MSWHVFDAMTSSRIFDFMTNFLTSWCISILLFIKMYDTLCKNPLAPPSRMLANKHVLYLYVLCFTWEWGGRGAHQASWLHAWLNTSSTNECGIWMKSKQNTSLDWDQGRQHKSQHWPNIIVMLDCSGIGHSGQTFYLQMSDVFVWSMWMEDTEFGVGEVKDLLIVMSTKSVRVEEAVWWYGPESVNKAKPIWSSWKGTWTQFDTSTRFCDLWWLPDHMTEILCWWMTTLVPTVPEFLISFWLQKQSHVWIHGRHAVLIWIP